MTRLVRLSLPALTVLALSVTSARAQTAAPKVLRVDPAQSRIEYTIVHKLHTVVGTSQQLEGAVRLLPNGVVQVMARAPIASFDSQNSGRDSHMRETMEATKYSHVTFKGTSSLAMPTSFPTTVKLDVRGELDFHGRRKPETVPVEITFTSPTEAKAIARFSVSLEKYEVERPSLMLMKIEDACQIALEMVLKQ